ncbi:MAG TPA: LacI family DNA-binding transcriptional regulator [Opitutaceae bacterium]|nr:LacI family DNA-binding transcriptional regulator [Opitutaceae bacterium]
MPRPTTLQDVADRARVHRSTVALALRDHPRIPPGTREKIKAIAEKLDYRINPFVAALMQSRRRSRAVRHATLAFVTNYPTRFGWRPQHHDRPDFFPGAVARAKEFGFKLEHFWLAEPGMTPARFSDILVTRGVHGLIIGRMPPGQHTLDLSWETFSSVALGMTLRTPRLHHVTENHFDTSWQAIQQCRERGYERVGFVFSEADDSPRVGDRWLGAYMLQQLKFPAASRLPACPGVPTDGATFTEWFRRERPDALVVTHAAPVIEWLRALGREVPRDVGLVELQDKPESGASGVYYDPAKIGALAVEMLVGLLHRNETGVPEDQHEVMLTGEWREGMTLPRRLKRA